MNGRSRRRRNVMLEVAGHITCQTRLKLLCSQRGSLQAIYTDAISTTEEFAASQLISYMIESR
jgi:hypothetical protein